MLVRMKHYVNGLHVLVRPIRITRSTDCPEARSFRNSVINLMMLMPAHAEEIQIINVCSRLHGLHMEFAFLKLPLSGELFPFPSS